MKRLFLIPLIVGSIMFPSLAVADAGTEFPIKIPIKKGGPTKGGHRVPGQIVSNCYYDNGVLTFVDGLLEGTISVTVTHVDSGTVWCGFVDEENPTMEVGTLPGTYTIVAQTIDGMELHGIYDL